MRQLPFVWIAAFLMSRRLRKLLFWSVGVAIGVIVLLTAAILIAARLIDTPKIRAQLAGRLSTLVGGQVAWEGLDLELLPLPHGVVRGLHLAIPDVVTVDVATADIKTRLLPLLRGNVEIQGITLEGPSLEVWIAASAEDETEATGATTPANPLALYRDAVRPVMDAVARFAPDTTVAVEEGRVALHVYDLQPFEASQLSLRIVTDDKGVAIDASAAGTYWDRIAVEGRVEFADLSAFVELDGVGLKPQSILESLFTGVRGSLVLPDVGTKVEVRTDGQTGIDLAFDFDLPKAALQREGKQLEIAQVQLAGSMQIIENAIDIAFDKVQLGELIPAAEVTLLLAGPKRSPELIIAIGELDLARLRDAAVTLAGDQPAVQDYISRIRGGRVRDLRFSTQAETFAELISLSHLQGSAQIVDASMQIPTVEREATRIGAHAEMTGGTIRLTDVSAQLGASQLRQTSADIVVLEPMRLEGTRGQVSIVLNDLLPGLRAREPFARALRSIPVLTGIAEMNVRNLALRFDRPNHVVYDLRVRPRHIRVDADQLPEPIDMHGGSMRVTARAVNADRIGIAALDSKATVSGELTGFQDGKLRVTARVADGVAQRKLIDWMWAQYAVDGRLKPATPLRFSADRVHWTDAVLDVVADVYVNAGPTLSVELSAADEAFTLRRATIKDLDSNANFSLAKRDSLMESGFDGVLAASSLAHLLGRTADAYPGSVRGSIQATVDLERQGRDSVRGQLAGERIDLRNLTGMPLKLGSFDMSGDGKALQIHELAVEWAEQKATIRGAVARVEKEFAATLEIDSPGIVVEALRGTTAPKTAGASSDKQGASDPPFDLWTLPLKGTVSLRTDFVEYGGYRVQGVRALAALEHEQAVVDLTEATLCGIAIPLSLRVTPKEIDARLKMTAVNQSIEGAAQCLAGKHLIITGNFNMSGELTVGGPIDQFSSSLAERLAGSVELLAENGVIRKMALLGNIMSLKSVSDLRKGDLDLGGNGFEYRSIAVGARVGEGKVTLEQAALDSTALGLAATGTINLQNYDSGLTVLVAPFGTIDRMARKIPVLGYIFGGSLTSIPVSVTGDIRDPIVVPLGPRAVGSEVLGVFERTFKLPGRLVEPLSTSQGK